MKQCQNPVCGATLKSDYCDQCGTVHGSKQNLLYTLDVAVRIAHLLFLVFAVWYTLTSGMV